MAEAARLRLHTSKISSRIPIDQDRCDGDPHATAGGFLFAYLPSRDEHAPLQPNTSSAQARSVGGVVKPSAFVDSRVQPDAAASCQGLKALGPVRPG